MDKVIRWGILGTGKIARAMAQGLRDAPGAQLVAVASRSSAGAQAFGAEFDIEHRHASYQALADDVNVDVIYIATPHTRHAENALMCLAAGKHVVCEKPFTMHAREAQAVVALAREKAVPDGSHVEPLPAGCAGSQTHHRQRRDWRRTSNTGRYRFCGQLPARTPHVQSGPGWWRPA